MVKKHGVFAYLVSTDEDLLLFSIRVEYSEVGTRHIKDLSLEWFGDNLTIISDEYIDADRAGRKGRKTGNLLLSRGVLYSGGNVEFPLERSANQKNDMIWVHTATGDGILGSFSLKLPKMIETIKISFSPPKSKCIFFQKKALLMGGITYVQYKEYLEVDVAPIPIFPDDWSILFNIECRDIESLTKA